ncbi:hypothetical protein [Dictyobacter kobayashii]|uniref:Uncharacterized protein n=1 Tax=Dictyobacter kobayashii TaxID=2014872 RepID=A0A402AV60_9CHLR|nr:hypothetical protein [Dictyobacter kobayashii]GCE22949.1 hypothetical protein KDK_67490 [Dictyobacter kobayashii]
MIDPEAILAQVNQKQIPSDWRVLHGRGSPIGAAILMGIFTLFFVGICEAIVVIAASFFGWFQIFQYSSATPEPTSPLPVSFDPTTSSDWMHMLWPAGLLLVLVPVALAVGVGLLARSRTERARNSLLILLPEGVVQCMDCSQPAKHSFKVLNYAEIVNLDLKVETTTSSYNEMTHSSSSHTSMWLNIHMRHGALERWNLNSLYAPPETTAQYIISGYAQYTALHPQYP